MHIRLKFLHFLSRRCVFNPLCVLHIAAHQRVAERCTNGAALNTLVEEIPKLRTVLASCPSQLALLLDDDIGMDGQVRQYSTPEVSANGDCHGCWDQSGVDHLKEVFISQVGIRGSYQDRWFASLLERLA